MLKNKKVTIFFGFLLIILVMVFNESCKQADEVVSSSSTSGGGNSQTTMKSVVSGLVISNLTGIAIVILVIAMVAIVRAGHDEDSWYDGLQ